MSDGPRVSPEKTTRKTSQAAERRPGQILERHDLAEDCSRQANLETICRGLRPTGTLRLPTDDHDDDDHDELQSAYCPKIPGEM